MSDRDGDVVLLTGALTMDTVPGVLETARAAIRDGARIVDFSKVTEADSAAIALGLELLREAEQAGLQLTLENLPPAMLKLASLYSVSTLLTSRDRC